MITSYKINKLHDQYDDSAGYDTEQSAEQIFAKSINER